MNRNEFARILEDITDGCLHTHVGSSLDPRPAEALPMQCWNSGNLKAKER